MEYILVGILIFLTLSLIVGGLIYKQSEKQVKARVENLDMDASATPVLKSDRAKKMEDSFTHRVLFPFAQTLSEKIQFIVPITGKSWINQKLIQAGYLKPHYFKIFLGIHALLTIGPPLFFLFLIMVRGTLTGAAAFMLVVMSAVIGFALPLLWLIQQAQKRQDSIRKSLPDFLDLLVICVEAGLGLDIAIAKIAKTEGFQSSEYLREELVRYTKDVGFGKPRKDALNDLAARTGVDDLNTIVNALVQSYEMGTGVVTALKVQADSLRQKRMHRAEEAANKIAVKMVMPIYMFFFPSIFIIILAPLILHVIAQVAGSGALGK